MTAKHWSSAPSKTDDPPPLSSEPKADMEPALARLATLDGAPSGSAGFDAVRLGNLISCTRTLPMTNQLRRVHRALLSVSDKTGLVEFARSLAARGVELIST